MKNLKINAPKGYEIDKEKSTFENIVFKKISELPKNWDELRCIEGYRINAGSPIRYRKNLFKTEDQAEASTALAQLSQLRDVYRQGWEPDFTYSDILYVIYFDEKHIPIVGSSYNSLFLSFQDTKTAELFLENFRDLIEKAKPLMS